MCTLVKYKKIKFKQSSWEKNGEMTEKMREHMKDKQRIVIKIGSSSLHHPQTGDLDYIKMEVLARELSDLRNQGKDVVLVSSGAIAVGKKAVRIQEGDNPIAVKQACASIGQARLMMTYQKLFAEYHQVVGQILMTKNTLLDDLNRFNAYNTFDELLKLGVIPIVNENDTVATYEIEFGDNDSLSAIVAALIHADLLILLSDIDGLYTDDPHKNKKAKFIDHVDKLNDEFMQMGKETTGSKVGTGGMNTKLVAAKIATSAGADMVIANAKDVRILHRILDGRKYGTMFLANKDEKFSLTDYLNEIHK